MSKSMMEESCRAYSGQFVVYQLTDEVMRFCDNDDGGIDI
jgi:hypothetical protein